MVEHEIKPGVTIGCPGTDTCRFCQLAKRQNRLERKMAKKRTTRRDRRNARQALKMLKEPLKRRYREYLVETKKERKRDGRGTDKPNPEAN
jgi:hypothetical protein